MAIVGIMPSGDSTVVLGTNFLRPHYTIFDYDNKRIGLAELKPPYHTWALVVIGIVITLLIILASAIDKQGIYGSNQGNIYGED